jgi:hypothetical protein
MAGVRMTSLRRAPNGDWFARKMIPEDVRGVYGATFGVRQEARFRVSSSTREPAAKQAFRDWDAEITSRIERLRADARGEGLASLTHRQAHALAGEWYAWFLAQYEEEPGDVEAWDHRAEEYETSCSKFASPEDDDFDPPPRTSAVRRSVHRALTALGRVEEFLHERSMVLAEEAKAAFLDARGGGGVPARAADAQKAL